MAAAAMPRSAPEACASATATRVALEDARPDRAPRARCTATSAPTARARRRRSDCCWGCTARAPAARELFGVDAWRDPVAAHRRVAYVAGEPFLWPALTSAETFEFLARLRGGTDVAYRDTAGRALPARHATRGSGAVEGQPPEGAADRGVRHPRRSADPRRADQRPGSADGGRLPRNA